MHRKISAFVVIASSILLAGCSSVAEQSPAVLPSSSSAPTQSSQDPSLVRTERGNLTRGIGETFSFRTSNDQKAATVRIDDIVENPKCDAEFSEKPKDGKLIALTFTVSTEPELSELGDVGFDGGWWKFIGSNGITYNGDLEMFAAFSCLDEKDRIKAVGPAEKAQGSVVLEVPDTNGILVYGLTDGIEFDLSKELK